MYSSSFVYLFVKRIMRKLIGRLSTKFSGNAADGPRKKPLDFGGNPDQLR